MTIAASYAALARLLDYPEGKERLQNDYKVVSAFMGQQRIDHDLSSFAIFADASSLADIQEDYVAAFDFNPATSPYLGHHLFGDNQKKGGYMIMLKQEYARCSYSPPGVELPDHLSVVLGFLSHLAGKDGEGRRQPFIADCVLPGMERLQTAFAARHDSPWNVLIDAARRLCVEDCKEVASC